MAHLDNRGLPISTSSERAAERYRDGVDLMLSTWPGADAVLNAAITADPGFALAHAARARLHAMRSESAQAKRRITEASELVAVRGTERERSHVAALSHALNGRAGEALAAVYAHADTWPRDVVVLSLPLGAFGLLAFSGRPDHDQARVDLCERHAGQFAADDWWFLTYRGWSHAENGNVAFGRDFIERGFGFRPHNANAAHALSHAMYEGGANDEADKLIRAWLPTYDRSGILHGHIAWHAALAALEHGDTERALAIYCEHVQPSVSCGNAVNVVSDSASFLWRLQAYGHQVPDGLWQAAATYAASVFPGAGFAFADVHMALLEAATGDKDAVEKRVSVLVAHDRGRDAGRRAGGARDLPRCFGLCRGGLRRLRGYPPTRCVRGGARRRQRCPARVDGRHAAARPDAERQRNGGRGAARPPPAPPPVAAGQGLARPARRLMSTVSQAGAGPLEVAPLPTSYPHERGNVVRLAIAQALAGANSTVVYATGAIVGNTLAPDKALATLPLSVFVVGMAACTLPAGLIAQRHGRRAAFLTGTGCGVLAGLLAALAVVLGSFPLFCLATLCGGAYAAVVLSFRFAAADCAPPERRPRALSAVMAGGVFAGVLGPQIVTYTMDLWQPYLFAASYVAQAAVAAASAFVLLGVRLPIPKAAETAGGRPLGVIVRQRRFVTAVICGVVSYLLMNFLMTAAPLAMRLCGLSQASANLGLQWHVIAMYGPSFFTGRLITRFGAPRVVAVGLALTATSAAVGLTGVDVATLLADPGSARLGLELRLRGGVGHGARVSPSRGKGAGAVVQRLRRVRHHGIRLIPVRQPVDVIWVEHGALAVVRSPAHRRDRPCGRGRSPAQTRFGMTGKPTRRAGGLPV